MEAIDLGKESTQHLNKFIQLAAQSQDANRRDDTIALLNSAIALYPADAITTEEINQTIPDRCEILTKLAMVLTDSATILDPVGVHVLHQTLIYNSHYVAANFYLGKLLMQNGNIAEAYQYLNTALTYSNSQDRFYVSSQKLLDKIVTLHDHKDPIFATDYLIGQAMTHALIDNPVGTFTKMSFDRIENKYDANVQMFPTDSTLQEFNRIRDFNSQHGFPQDSFEQFLPANLPLFEIHNRLSSILGTGYTLIDEGAEIYDVCGLNIEPQLSFTFYKLIKNDTQQISYLLLSGKNPLEMKARKLRQSDDFTYHDKIFDVYKTKIIFNANALIHFIPVLAQNYFGDKWSSDAILHHQINGIHDASFNQTLNIHPNFQLKDSRVHVLIDTNQTRRQLN
jgi:hypothetical protein